jgi:hypothetical protein
MKVTIELQKELIEKLEANLAGAINHEDMQKHAWNCASYSPKEPPANESVYWEAVFSVIHLADEQHWCDGCTERDLSFLCKKLKNNVLN